jgi:glutathione synthase/RimK-type ligase-like ATP-grasp enzyme
MVIILAQPTDVHALSVAYEVEQSGERALILDTADYPEKWQLSISIGKDVSWEISTGHEQVRSTDVTGVWWRRIRAHEIAAEVIDDRVRRFCVNEARGVLLGWAHALGRRVINPVGAERAATAKLFQLVTARRLGLTLPESLITNAPDAVRRFAETPDTDTVFKTHNGADFQMLETRELQTNHLEHLSSLTHAPVIFQRRICGTDVRVTIIDDHVYPVSIHPLHPGAAFDWRLDVAPRYQPYELPPAVERQLKTLLRELGLRYGAVDLRVTPAGEHVFLEVNPTGQFLFVEIAVGLPISRAFAAALMRRDGDEDADGWRSSLDRSSAQFSTPA